jgi:hypothetical protein
MVMRRGGGVELCELKNRVRKIKSRMKRAREVHRDNCEFHSPKIGNRKRVV